jgi:MFS family permease
MFRTFVIAVLSFIVGAISTYFVVVVGVAMLWDLMEVHDQDGGGLMALGLLIGPVCAAIVGIICAIFVPIRVAKRRGHAAPATAEEKRRDLRRIFLTCGTVGSGLIGYKIGRLMFWFLVPSSIGNRWKFLAISWTPTVMMLLCAVAGALIVHCVMRLPKSDHPKANIGSINVQK